MNITLRWADGHDTPHQADDLDPTGTTLIVKTPDGLNHYFRATDDIDENNRDVYVEEPPE